MIEQLDFEVIRDFATALLIGALIGVEREKRKGDGEPGIGGLRTFILFALVGAVAGFLSRGGGVPWVLLAAMLPVAGAGLRRLLAGHQGPARTRSASPPRSRPSWSACSAP